MNRWRLLLAGLVLVSATASSQAGVRIGIGFGLPFYGPFYGPPCYYRPYYYGPPVVYAPPPVLYAAPAPAPVVVQPAPVVTRSPETAEPAPALPPPPPSSTAPTPPATLAPVVRGSRPGGSDLPTLSDPDPQARADAIMRLGRNRDRQALAPITRALREDGSPVVREAAARALGLIAVPASLSALQHAAQADDDRDVRRSASFAADVIRTNLRR